MDIQLNIVTCGMCAQPFGHTLEVNELTCPYCKYSSDICDFPDFFYPSDNPQINRIDSIINISQPLRCAHPTCNALLYTEVRAHHHTEDGVDVTQ